jgi:hypothetical protein
MTDDVRTILIRARVPIGVHRFASVVRWILARSPTSGRWCKSTG